MWHRLLPLLYWVPGVTIVFLFLLTSHELKTNDKFEDLLLKQHFRMVNVVVASLVKDSPRNWLFCWGGVRNEERRTRDENEAQTRRNAIFLVLARFRSFAAYLGARQTKPPTTQAEWSIFINSFPFFSSGVLDTSERDSNRKTRWNSAINEPDRTSASSSSEYSPVSTLRKSTKSRNEATLLFRFVGDINILVTPLILEALQRFVAKPLQFALFCFFLINSLWRLILTFCLLSQLSK